MKGLLRMKKPCHWMDREYEEIISQSKDLKDQVLQTYTIGDNGCAFSIFFIQKLKFLLSVIRKIFQSSTLGDDLDCGLSKEFYALIKVYMRRRDIQ